MTDIPQRRYKGLIYLLEENFFQHKKLIKKFKKYSLPAFLGILRFEFEAQTHPQEIIERFLEFVELDKQALNEVDDEIKERVFRYLSYFNELAHI